MRYSYYSRLSRRDQAIYRRSDAIKKLVLPKVGGLLPHVAVLRERLESEDRRGAQKAANALSNALLGGLEVERAKVRVLATRPSSAESELHGLYEREEDTVAVIRVWMRTAAKGQVVKFRTFLRTLIHELGHHLDYEHLELADSFHTEGFFRRESSLMRQLAPKPAGRPKKAGKPKKAKKAVRIQLELPFV